MSAEPPQADPDAPAELPSEPRGTALIREYLKHLPGKPGVYRMYDEAGEPLYVGKAKDLKKRVTAYAKLAGHANRIAQMILSTVRMEFVVTESETEALLLEANLIKKLRPKYNIILRDDKTFPHILIALDHEAPQILKHRGARKRKGHYFGPFASAGAVNRTLNTLQKAFLLRSCSDSVYSARTRPCLLYQIKRCAAPCVDLISEEDYRALVGEAVDFLNGRSTGVQAALSKDMETAAAELDFERAAGLRDRIRALSAVRESQGVNPHTFTEADVFAVHAEGGRSCVQAFFFRAGQNWGARTFFPRHDKSAEPDEILDAFLAQFYDGREPPKLILTNATLPSADLLSQALTLRAGRNVSVNTPQRGEKREIVGQAHHNARDALARHVAESASQRRLLEGVADLFDLDAPPERIEVYDNSHISGAKAVGGMIVAGAEGLEKNQYRKFNMKSEALTPGDDYGMMREMLTRRFSRLQKESEDGAALWPDLILIDGGQGQLSAAREVLGELGIENVAVAAIAKGPDRNAGREEFYLPDRAVFSLPPKDPVLFYLQRLRDEAHRFAIGAHRTRRKKAMGESPLDTIDGVGPKRKRALLNRFGSARAVARAKVADLADVEGVSQELAQRIYDTFHG